MPKIEQWVPHAQAAFVAAMQTAAAYPAHATETPIRCVQTHISWVFLTGPYAYKVKQPVELGFVDYSTLARREFFCHEELRLNRRHAPDLYVDVVPVGGTRAMPRVGDTSTEPVEFALRMVQFDPRFELSQLLAADAVEAREIAALGVALARAQEAAPRSGAQDPFGEPANVHRVTLDNFAELGQVLHDDAAQHLVAELRAEVNTRFEASRALMATRRAGGCVRECHGDLHCRNVVRWRETLLPFDGLEFDPALRFIDVASDVAFLAMDLAVRARPDLRRSFLNAWAETSGDFGAAELLPYYETYRALVRAKVAALRIATTADAATGAHDEALGYLRWARSCSVQAKPLLVLMSGLSGSGKTWLAGQLAPQLDAFHVRSDIERKRLAGLGPLQSSASPPDAGIYTLQYNELTYARLLQCATHCVRGNASVIVDAANLRRAERTMFADLAKSLQVPIAIVHCTAPLAELKERVAQRRQANADASEATPDLLDRQPAYWEAFEPGEIPSVIEAHTGGPHPFEAGQLLHALQAVRCNTGSSN
jgi:aminoglycoside phosphotransferase family enzyme/predicted kinase